MASSSPPSPVTGNGGQQQEQPPQLVPINALAKVSLHAVVQHVLKNNVGDLMDRIVEELPSAPDMEKKKMLWDHLQKARSHILRLMVLTKWCNRIPQFQAIEVCLYSILC